MFRNVADFHIFCCWPTHLIRLEMAVKTNHLKWLNHKFYAQKFYVHNGNSVKIPEVLHISFIKANMDNSIVFGSSNNYPFCTWMDKRWSYTVIPSFL